MNRYEKNKRIFDILFSINLFIITLPIYIVLPFIIKIDSKGPIFYKQERVGKNSKKFTIYKFRTMTIDTNEITRVGKVIRKYGIDELPQIFNILKGDMSVVGPRPWKVDYLKYFNKNQLKRFDVLPGLMGPTNCLEKDESVINKIALDIDYIDNRSFKTDMKLLFKMISHWIPILKYRSASTYDSINNIEKEYNELKKCMIEDEIKENQINTNVICNRYSYNSNDYKPKQKLYKRL